MSYTQPASRLQPIDQRPTHLGPPVRKASFNVDRVWRRRRRRRRVVSGEIMGNICLGENGSDPDLLPFLRENVGKIWGYDDDIMMNSDRSSDFNIFLPILDQSKPPKMVTYGHIFPAWHQHPMQPSERPIVASTRPKYARPTAMLHPGHHEEMPWLRHAPWRSSLFHVVSCGFQPGTGDLLVDMEYKTTEYGEIYSGNTMGYHRR